MRRWGGGIDFSDFDGRWILVSSFELSTLEPELREHMVPGGWVANRVFGWCHDPTTWPDMLNLCEHLSGNRFGPSTSVDVDGFIIPFLQRAFERGVAVAVFAQWGAERRIRTPEEEEGVVAVASSLQAPQVPANEPSPKISRPRPEKPKVWIGIKVQDQDKSPLPGRHFRLTLPDGSLESGETDSAGLARVDGMDPGLCKFELLDVDRGSAVTGNVKPLTKLELNQLSDSGRSWVKVKLVDPFGKPIGGRKFQIVERDGTVHRGTVSDDGTAEVKGLTIGTCSIRFDDVHESEVKRVEE